MNPSKKGFDVLFNTAGTMRASQARAASLMRMGMDAAKLKYERDMQLQKMTSEAVTKNRNVDGRGQSDFDQELRGKLDNLTALAESGNLTVSDIMQASVELDSNANVINKSYALADDMVKEAKNRGYVPERIQEFNYLQLHNTDLKGREKAESFLKIQEQGAFSQLPFSSYLIDEGQSVKLFLEQYGVNAEEVKNGVFLNKTETKMEIFERAGAGGFRVKRDADGLVSQEVYAESLKDPRLSRILTDAVYFDAYQQVVKETGTTDIDYDDVQKVALTGYDKSNPVSSGFMKLITAKVQAAKPEDMEKIQRSRLTQILDNSASGKFDVSTIPESASPKRYTYKNGAIYYGNEFNEMPISVKAEMAGGYQFYTVPKDGRKPVAVQYKGETYNMVPMSYAATGDKLYLRGNVLVKATTDSEQSAFAQIMRFANGNGVEPNQAVEFARQGVIDGVDKDVAKSLKIVNLASDAYAVGDESAANIISEGVGLDPRSVSSSGNIITILSSMQNKAKGTVKNDDLYLGN
jgi:hypothetical protein